MQIRHLRLANWKNFQSIHAPLQQRTFLVGPNAAGKSNLLDAIRFLRDVAEIGFEHAVRRRGGIKQIRCLHARRSPNVGIELDMALAGKVWRYELQFGRDQKHRTRVRKERVTCDGEVLLERPNTEDKADRERLRQTHLEQINANQPFRQVATFFSSIRYLHVIPQLVRDPGRTVPRQRDPFGSDFLEQLNGVNKRTRELRLRKINAALQVAVPQLKELRLEPDDRGVPHLEGRYEHWRPNAGWQDETHFSDGTLRLMGLLWALLDGDSPLLLEEPELSLHVGIVRMLPAMMARVGANRQILISTHSADLLSDEGITPEEVLLLMPEHEGTRVLRAAEDQQIRALVEAGTPLGEAVLPPTTPPDLAQLSLFDAR